MNHLNFSWIIEGKLAGHSAPHSEKDLTWLKEQGILSLVRMAEQDEEQVSNKIAKLDIWDLHEPVTDFEPPELYQILRMVEFINASCLAGRPVGVSCGAGYGRTGTILACYLVSQCYDAEAAIKEVREKRPGSIENKKQEDAIRQYAATLNKQS
ncbi:MAG: dual specificity protein phosphatase family protein [Dehalococcoidales bacterium]|nr:dual specificity protein phosphatase family protein [Dehalococcoidales bacterium]